MFLQTSLYQPPMPSLQTAEPQSDLLNIRLDSTKEGGLVVGEPVHRRECNVQTTSSMINGEDIDGVASVGRLPTGSTVGRVPAGDGRGASNVREAPDCSLCLPAVLGN